MIHITSQVYEPDFEAVLYGALFHDIGKFYQRTRDQVAHGTITAAYNWYITGLGKDYISHEQWSAHFLRTVLGDEKAEMIALRHHHPESSQDYMVAIADKLSAAERDEEEDNPKHKKDVARVPLYSMLSAVRGIRQAVPEPACSYRPLHFDPQARPHPVGEPEQAIRPGDYSQWWNKFVREVEQIVARGHRGEKKLQQLHQLLWLYTQTIPSAAYYSAPTISLFDHARTTAAIACALYRQDLPLAELEKLHRALGSGPRRAPQYPAQFLLVAGDISGIQNFVYDLTAKGATKGLRGRSFYLTMLGEAIASYIVRAEQLSPCNILYVGGGHFYLLLPASSEPRLAAYQQYIDEILFTAHQGKLAVVLSAVPLSASDFTPEHIAEKWRQAGALLQKGKNRKYLALIRQDPRQVLGPFYEGQDVCTVCGSRGSRTEGKCSFCRSFEELGDALARDYPYLNEYLVPPRRKPQLTEVNDVWAALGLRLELARQPRPEAIVAVINQPVITTTGADRILWISNATPHAADGSILTFARLAERSQGDNKWGVLRGDVDNLGRIFHRGLGGEEERSISKIASLSREMSLFFSVVLNQICLRQQDTVYVIYAGGDDFFLVGSWSTLPDLAMEINRQFKCYCGHNPHISLSCSITIAPGITYPLYKVAQQAGQELDEKAKSSRLVNRQTHEKDSLCFLGHPFTWEEMTELAALKDLIVQAIQEQGVSRALLTRIYAAYADQKAFLEQKYPLGRIWRLVYALSRLSAMHSAAQHTLKELETRLLTRSHLLAHNAIYAARWAEKLLRTRGDGDDHA